MRSVLLDRSGAVAERSEDSTAWHYGDPLREQRHLATVGAIVDRGDRELLKVIGPDRLSWMHTITSQHISELTDATGTELLVLTPQGRVEHHAMVFHDAAAQTIWLDTEPGAAAGLHDYLLKMRFYAEVEIEEATSDWALLTHTGTSDLAAPDVLPVPGPKFASGSVPARPSTIYSGAVSADGGFVRRTDILGTSTVDELVPRSKLAEVIDGLGLPLAGHWAFDTLRIPALRARVGVDTDHKTIPHEIDSLLRSAVHLEKGCYRGQETVARVHNLGKPPRSLVVLHLDGTSEAAPPPGAAVMLGDRPVGVLGTASRHYEDGMIALALVRRNITEQTEPQLVVEGMAAGL